MRPPVTGAPQSYGSLQSQESSSGPPSFNQSFPGPGPFMPGSAPSRAQAPAQPGKLHSLNVEQLPCSHCVAFWHYSELLDVCSKNSAWAHVSSCCRLQSTATASSWLPSAARAAWAEAWDAWATWATASRLCPAWICHDKASRCKIMPLWAATVVRPLKHIVDVAYSMPQDFRDVLKRGD